MIYHSISNLILLIFSAGRLVIEFSAFLTFSALLPLSLRLSLNIKVNVSLEVELLTATAAHGMCPSAQARCFPGVFHGVSRHRPAPLELLLQHPLDVQKPHVLV